MSRLRLKNQRGRLYLQSPSHGAHCPLNFERLEGRRLLSVNGGDSQIAVDPDFNDGVGNVVEANPSTNSGGPIANFSAQAQASELPKHPAVFTAFLPPGVSRQEFAAAFRDVPHRASGSVTRSLVGLPEAEPNDSPALAQEIALGFDSDESSEIDIEGVITTPGDQDFYRMELEAGDILGANIQIGAFPAQGPGNVATLLSLRNGAGIELIGSGQDLTPLHPSSSPLPGGGNASLSWVVGSSGTYQMHVGGGSGNYLLNLRLFRPEMESRSVGQKQTLFLDFDGATIDPASFGSPVRNTYLSPLSDFLPNWGLGNESLDAVINSIVGVVKENIERDIAAKGNNGNFDSTQNPGDFGITILNSRDHADPFGRSDVSRMIIGGTMAEFTIPTIGLSESIDVGNFETNETGVVLLDSLSDPDPTNLASLNQYPIDPNSSIIELIGVGVGNIVTHEAGHFFGAWHQNPFNGSPSIMDAAAQANVVEDPVIEDPLVEAIDNNASGGDGVSGLDNILGIGPDGVFGSVDDYDVDFLEDQYFIAEGFTGVEDVVNVMAFGLSTGARGYQLPATDRQSASDNSAVWGQVYQEQTDVWGQQPDDQGISDVLVYLDCDNNGSPGVGEPSARSDEDGHYLIPLDLETNNPAPLQVDVFLLMDESLALEDENTNDNVHLQNTLPRVVNLLDMQLSEFDLAFGVGRFDDYGGGFLDNDQQTRPFVLSQPILETSHPLFNASLIAALGRNTPVDVSYDQPKTVIEALYQTATGVGFDGDGNGTTDGSTNASSVQQLAGEWKTQVAPNGTGDVPSFDTFISDSRNRIVDPAGDLGGVGFRNGALKLALVMTDDGLVFEPDMFPVYVSTDGDAVLAEDIQLDGRATTPGQKPTATDYDLPAGRGAQIQETIYALNALGIKVVGLGSDTDPLEAPRKTMQALARLTGAVNNTRFALDSGVPGDPISPADPFYFVVNTGFPDSIADAIAQAVRGVTGEFAGKRNFLVRQTSIAGMQQTTPNLGDSSQIVSFFPDEVDRVAANVDFGNRVALDYGDAPAPYPTLSSDNGPVHGLLDNFYLGKRVDAEDDGLPTGQAQGDDLDGLADEDGVEFTSPLNPGGASTLEITAGPAAAAGYLQGWIDFNADGDWNDGGEQIFKDVRLSPGLNSLSYEVPASIADDGHFARFRLGFETGLAPIGPSQSGEVEDYSISAAVVEDDAFQVDEDTSENELDVFANDLVSVATARIIGVGASNQGGTVSIANDGGSLIYTPVPNFFGVESFTYTVEETDGRTSLAIVAVEVENVNDQPQAADDAFETVVDGLTTLDVLANDTFAPDLEEVLTIAGTGQASQGGLVSIRPGGQSLRYLPKAGFTGQETFSYTVSDGNGGTDQATVTVNVTADDSPAADPEAVAQGGEFSVNSNSQDNVYKVPLQDATITLAVLPSNGTAHVNATTGEIFYTPDVGFVGSDLLSFALQNPTGTLSSDTSLTISVNEMVSTSMFYNVVNPLDVDGNGVVTAADVFKIAWDIVFLGSRQLPDTQNADLQPPFIDTNGDKFVTAVDVFLVANHLTAQHHAATALSNRFVAGDQDSSASELIAFAESDQQAMKLASVDQVHLNEDRLESALASRLADDSASEEMESSVISQGSHTSAEMEALITDLAGEVALGWGELAVSKLNG